MVDMNPEYAKDENLSALSQHFKENDVVQLGEFSTLTRRHASPARNALLGG